MAQLKDASTALIRQITGTFIYGVRDHLNDEALSIRVVESDYVSGVSHICLEHHIAVVERIDEARGAFTAYIERT
jgi:hypothetical protein